MESTFESDFREANETIHPVEQQWHYPILTKYGFVPITKTAQGFVRSYVYEHPVTREMVSANTGASADYWETTGKGSGDFSHFWAGLEPYLKSKYEKAAEDENSAPIDRMFNSDEWVQAQKDCN